MKTKLSNIIILGIIIISFLLGVYFYPMMPEEMASHWGISGEVDDYMPKFWGIFLMPLISVFMFFLFWLVPKIDPLRSNIEKFRKYYNGFIVLIFFFLFYIYLLTVFWNIGFRFSISQLITPALAILFYYSGILIEKARRNWFIGIRTPWTLSSDKVWEKTHKLGSRFFKIAAVISLFGIFFKNTAFYLVIFPIIFFSVYLVIYSYFEFQKEKKNKI